MAPRRSRSKPVQNVKPSPHGQVVICQAMSCSSAGYFGPKNKKARKTGRFYKFYNLEAPEEPWQNVRYRIERSWCIHSDGKYGRRVHQFQYVDGIRYDPTDQRPYAMRDTMGPNELVRAGDKIITLRLPTYIPPYVPPKYRKDYIEAEKGAIVREDMTEDEKVQAVMMEASLCTLAIRGGHAGDIKSRRSTETQPPRQYVCHRCGKRGHWKESCPELDNPNHVPIRSIPWASGIPRSELKPVETDEEMARSFMDPKNPGQLVCRIRSEEKSGV